MIKHGVRNGFLITAGAVFLLQLALLLVGETAIGLQQLLLVPLFYGAIGAAIGLVVEVVINHQRLHAPREELQEETYEELQEEPTTRQH